MFELTGVRKTYCKRGGSDVTAFQVERLSITRGEYVAVVGPSGSGKTTLLSLLGGMLSPDAGEVRLGEASLYALTISERAEIRRKQIGFVFQTFNLLPYLTALENVQVPLLLAGCDRASSREQATVLLSGVGLGDRLAHKPGELSTGQQQRVALARTLANDPQVILADEPTGNLDPDSREQVLDRFDLLVELGKTIVMVTHDTAAAQRADRRLRLREGRLTDERNFRIVA